MVADAHTMMQVSNTYFNEPLCFTKQLSIKVSLPKWWHINEALTLDRKKSVVTKGVVEGGCNGCGLLLSVSFNLQSLFGTVRGLQG